MLLVLVSAPDSEQHPDSRGGNGPDSVSLSTHFCKARNLREPLTFATSGMERPYVISSAVLLLVLGWEATRRCQGIRGSQNAENTP